MSDSRSLVFVGTVLALGLAISVPLGISSVDAQDGYSRQADPGFVPNTGQINPGVPEQGASQSHEAVIRSLQQAARAALMMPIPTQPSTGDMPGSNAQPPTTTGVGGKSLAASPSGEPPPSGPIGSVGQTIPAKLSERNNTLDHVPTMAWPLHLNDQQVRQIYEAVMSDSTKPTPGADALVPSSMLTIDQALDGTHPLPASVSGIAGLNGLTYMKTERRVLLVEPSTRVVVDEVSQ
jgi:hypothetical protein